VIYRARLAAMKSVVDQENLRLKIDEWTADSDQKLQFRPYVEADVRDG